ncbi:hypothetical protein N7495_004630 [Penicillium taxi]|uniref:uncharacterized protein n=1 Tax=Penicillium taxi TaxID=168475 RepID=UPI0025455B2F|nr:uncharacterized protein N7495_004630 [Penicillium taxi]KAJ5899886.1 hypothetical protein N7495_004630 [Penicillium taxi]
MSCLTCKRRKKQCDDKRPRCTTCKASHIRCTYEGPPSVLQFYHEFPESKAVVRTDNKPDVDRLQKTLFQPAVNGELQQASSEDLFSEIYLSWDDDFPMFSDFDYGTFSAPAPDIQMPELPLLSSQETKDATCMTVDDAAGSRNPISDTLHDQPPAKRPREYELPTHLLAHHYSRDLAGRFSFKRRDWTFYTYFLHRFGQSHPWVLSSILAWTSANLFYTGKTKSLDEALRHYQESLQSMTRKYGVATASDSAIDGGQIIAENSSDDIDALFVAYFFLALVDVVMARPGPLRDNLRFIAAIIRIPDFKNMMTGVQARVTSWFCILDAKASAIQPGEGAVLEAMGDEETLVQALRHSSTTLQQAYAITYLDEERTADEKQLPLLDRMLRLMWLLHQITKSKRTDQNSSDAEDIRIKLNSYHLEVESDNQYEGRSRSTFLVLCALYHAVEISFSRCFKLGERRHAANNHAEEIICISQKLRAMLPAGSALPPPTKIWPLPLVMAAIEVEDIIYREWAVQVLGTYQQVAGDHYAWAKKFVETVCEKEDGASQRLDWAIILNNLKNGLVI